LFSFASSPEIDQKGGAEMGRKIETLEDFKRILYLWISPLLIAALAIYNLVPHTGTRTALFYLATTRILIAWNALFLICMVFKRYFRLFDYVNLVILTVYYLAIVMDCVFQYMVPGKEGAIGISIIWSPLLFLYIFITLKKRNGIIYSLALFVTTLLIGMPRFRHFSFDYKISMLIFYLANLVYIAIFCISHYLLKVFRELEEEKKKAYSDILTGIANRRQVQAWLDAAVKHADKTGTSFSVIFFDIDYFKQVNDQFGHQTGDEVLKEFVRLSSRVISANDYIGRWGGEEFIIITKDELPQAEELAEYLKASISRHSFGHAGKLSASFGVTAYTPGDTAETIVRRVDEGLYKSKGQGRNRITVL
jgi:diguanylate cyclase (GGDEF)-like protein